MYARDRRKGVKIDLPIEGSNYPIIIYNEDGGIHIKRDSTILKVYTKNGMLHYTVKLETNHFKSKVPIEKYASNIVASAYVDVGKRNKFKVRLYDSYITSYADNRFYTKLGNKMNGLCVYCKGTEMECEMYVRGVLYMSKFSIKSNEVLAYEAIFIDQHIKGHPTYGKLLTEDA